MTCIRCICYSSVLSTDWEGRSSKYSMVRYPQKFYNIQRQSSALVTEGLIEFLQCGCGLTSSDMIIILQFIQQLQQNSDK